MAESNDAAKSAQNSAPVFVLGASTGAIEHTAMKRVPSTVLVRTPKGVGVRISKNLSEQFEPVQGSHPANAR